jgi:hypothetical protein
VLVYAAILAVETGDLEEARRAADEIAELGRCHGEIPDHVAFEKAIRACIGTSPDTDEIDDAALDRALDQLRTPTHSLLLTYGLTLAARGRAHQRSLDAGMAAVREGLAWARDHDQHYIEPPLLIAEAQLLDLAGDIDAAQVALRQACEIARRQGAGWFEQQTVESLSAMAGA